MKQLFQRLDIVNIELDTVISLFHFLDSQDIRALPKFDLTTASITIDMSSNAHYSVCESAIFQKYTPRKPLLNCMGTSHQLD